MLMLVLVLVLVQPRVIEIGVVFDPVSAYRPSSYMVVFQAKQRTGFGAEESCGWSSSGGEHSLSLISVRREPRAPIALWLCVEHHLPLHARGPVTATSARHHHHHGDPNPPT